jgi:hypothetical protein
MKLSFLPADLHLRKDDEEFVLTLAGEEILRTKVQKKAVTRFNALRTELESKYPARELTPEEKAEALQHAITDGMLGHNSLGGRKKKSTAGGTRTFGG